MIQNFSYRSFVFLLLASLLLGLLFTGCKNESTAEPSLETSTVADTDGNVYKTVKIGNQWWMAENLKTKTYSNGTPVRELRDVIDWQGLNAGYCLFDGNTSAPGLLYNYNAVSSINKLAPNGWHIPTDEEWKQLEKHLGMSANEAEKLTWRGTNEGDKLKIEGPLGWSESEGIWGTNESGFTALAGSCRLINGAFGSPGLFATGFWWSATTYNTTESYYRYLDYKESRIFRSHVSNKYGMSVRCVKD